MANNKGKCQVCSAISESFCSWCKLVFYCSREHQKKDWANHKEACTKKKYRMEENEQLGRHLVASEDIKPDLILFKDKPIVLSYKLDTLDFTRNKICLGCYKEIPWSPSSSVNGKKNKEGDGEDHYKKKNRKKDREDREAQMKRAAAVASLLEKVVDKEKKKKEKEEQHEQTALSVGGGVEPGKVEKSLESSSKSSSSGARVSLQSRNNEEDHHNDHRQRENDDGGDGDDDQQQHFQERKEQNNNHNNDDDHEIPSSSVEEESEEYEDSDNSSDDEVESEEGEVEVEEEKVCVSCHLPICSQLCSTQYFHKNFECKLVREAYYHHHQQQQQQQKLQNVTGAAQNKKALSEKESSPSSLSLEAGEQRGKQSICNQEESMSPGTTCKNKASSCSPTTNTTAATATFTSTSTPLPRNMITSMRNGIRETLLRNLLYLRCLLLKHENEGHWNQLISLQSNEETRKGDVASLEKSARVFTVMKKIMTEINHPTLTSRQLVYKPDIHKLIGIIEINALHVNISQNVEVTGIYPTFSLLEHSCIPSVKYYLVPCGGGGTSTFATNTASNSSSSPLPTASPETGSIATHHHKKASPFFELYCRSAIKLKAGDHLSVCYTNAIWNTDKRREFLKKERHFWCECKRCKSKLELDTNFSSILCPLPECRGICAPVPLVTTTTGPSSSSGAEGGIGGGRAGNNNEIQWKCTSATCQKTCAAWQVKILDTKLCEMVGRTKPSLEAYKKCLGKMEEIVHPSYYLCCILTHSVIQMCGHDADSVHDKALLEEKIALCNRLLGVIRKLDPGLANLNIYASIVFYEIQNAVLALAGAEVDDDFTILRSNPETVNLAKVYLQKCIDCFKYEFLETPENKLKILAMKKMEYLNTVMNKR